MGNLSSKQKTVPRPPSPPRPASHDTPPSITPASSSYPFEPPALVLPTVPETEESCVDEEMTRATSSNVSDSCCETDTLLTKSVGPIIPMFRRETDNEFPEIETMEAERRKSVRIEDELLTSTVSVSSSRNVEISPEDE